MHSSKTIGFWLCGVLPLALLVADCVGAEPPATNAVPRNLPAEWTRFVEAHGSRAPGMPGNLALQTAVEQRFADSGFTNGTLRFETPVFEPGKTQIRLADGISYPLMPMHPSLMRPGNFKEPEFDASLVYLGRGRVEDLTRAHGVQLDGGVAVMEFDCGDRWMDVLRFGIRGFIFLPAKTYAHSDAVEKVHNSEVSVPRFLASEAAAAALRERFAAAQSTPATVIADPSRWRMQAMGSPWVLIPGSDPDAARNVLLLTAPIDSSGVVPEMAFGGDSAGNLMMLLNLLEKWRRQPPRCSVMLVAINAHTQGYLGERLLAWHLLQNQANVSSLRDNLALETRMAQIYVDYYKRLKLEPVTLAPDPLADATRVLWALHDQELTGDTQALDDATLLAAVDLAMAKVTDRLEGMGARFFMTDEGRTESETTLRRLRALRDGGADALRAVLVEARSTFEDELLLEDWRSLMDASTGVRLAVKAPLQDRVQRELNITKVEQMDLASDGVEDESQIAALRARRAALTTVLVLFNKIDIGYGRERVRYRQVATDSTCRKLLAGFRDDTIEEMELRKSLFQRRLAMDGAREEVRRALGFNHVSLAITLDIDWSSERFGFMALSALPRQEWYRALGDQAAAIAAALPAPSDGKRVPYVDTLSAAVGEPQDNFFFGQRSAAGLFHAAAAVPSLSLRSAFSAPRQAFTPRNRAADLDPESTAATFEWLSSFLAALASEPGAIAQQKLTIPWNQGLWSCLVKTFEMDEYAPKPTPSLRVPNSFVVAYSPKAGPEGVLPSIVDGQVAYCYSARADETAFAVLYGLPESPLVPDAYQLDPSRQTRIEAVIDKGRIQESQQMSSDLLRAPSKLLPMFQTREFVIGNRIDTSRMGRAPVDVSMFYIYSAHGSAAPRKYGVQGAASLSRAKARSASGPVGVYQELKRRRDTGDPLIVMTDNRRFAVNPTDANPEGVGFESPSELDRDFMNLAARDMYGVIRHRLDNMKGIVNELIEEFMDQGRSALQAAAQARDTGNHTEWRRSSAVALGALGKAYTQIRTINADMLKSIMIYMALMLPFCYFLQKLIFSFTRMEHEMLGFGILFVTIYVVFRLIHPAFGIAMSPEAIFLAFVLGTVGVFVTSVLHSRFSAEMDIIFRGASGFAAEASTAFVGQTAMIIGVNNMKRRRTRTTLTTATIVLVVFTMLAFSSVSRKVRPTLIMQTEKAPYTGIFFTRPDGSALDEGTLRVFETLYAGRGKLLARRVLNPGTTPNGNRVRWPIERADSRDATAMITSLISLSPMESEFSGAIPFEDGGMFSDDYADEIILPSPLADAMGIGADDVGRTQVLLLGHRLTVVGILDAERYLRMRDLAPNASLLPTGKINTQEGAAAPSQNEEGASAQDLASLAFLPSGLLQRLGGRPYSVSFRIADAGPSSAGRTLWDEVDVLLRTTDAMFTMGSVNPFKVGAEARRATDPGVYQVVGAYRTTIGGLSRLIVPLLIAGLILFNTMLGAVYERKAEIAIYNAIGLNPRHIFIFFLAEALVYGVIGAIGGYLIGQILAITAQAFDLVKGINVNFSSLMVVWAIMFTIGLVLLSTIYPAWVAVRTAVPSGTTRWSLPKHDGQRMLVDLPFIYEPDLAVGVMAYLHEILSACVDDSMSELLVETLSLSGKETANGHPVFAAEYSVALAPFDLGVTQSMLIAAQFMPTLESYEMNIDIQRKSGQDTSWATVNQPMLERLRKALLRWRNMDPGRHQEYTDAGRRLFEV